MSALAYAETHPIQIGAGVFAVGLVMFLAVKASSNKPTVVQTAPTYTGYNAQAVAANQQLQAMQIAGQVKTAGYSVALRAAQDKNAVQLQIANLQRLTNQDNIAASNALATTQVGAAMQIHQIDGSVVNHKTDTQLAALQVQAETAKMHDGYMYGTQVDNNSTARDIAAIQADVQKNHDVLKHNDVIENKDVLIKQAEYAAQAEASKASSALAIMQNGTLEREYIAGLESTTRIQEAGYKAASAHSSGGSQDNTGQMVASAAMMALMFL